MGISEIRILQHISENVMNASNVLDEKHAESIQDVLWFEG